MPRSSNLSLENVDVEAELGLIGWTHDPAGEDELLVLCPAHDDDRPSAQISLTTGAWRCYACKAKGSVVSFLSAATGKPRSEIVRQLEARYDIRPVRQIKQSVVAREKALLWSGSSRASQMLQELHSRGLTDDTIRRLDFGLCGTTGRITIPVYDSMSRVVAKLKYEPGADENKFVNTRGFSETRLFGVSDLARREKVLFCGGPVKAAVAQQLLAGHEVACLSSTGGEGTWDKRWTPWFAGKRVWVCMDVDDAGRQASVKVGRALYTVAAQVSILRLPLDAARFPKGDLNDWAHAFSPDAADLLRLMESSEQLVIEDVQSGQSFVGEKSVPLDGALDSRNMGYLLTFDATPTMRDEAPYLVPVVVDASCDRDQPNCHVCPIKMREPDVASGTTRCTIEPTSRGIIEMAGMHDSRQRDVIRRACNVPHCKTVTFTPREHQRVWDTRVSPSMKLDASSSSSYYAPAMIVGDEPVLNTPYEMHGVVHPNPKNQSATLLVDSIRPSSDSLDTFSPTLDELRELDVFRAEDESDPRSVQQKLDWLYDDMSSRITHIYGRRDMHMTVDLTYHSVLFVKYRGKTVNGWLNSAVVGDSSQGKTEVATSLIGYYDLGERVDCKNASVAGVVGGVQQVNGRWFMGWGKIPQNDRRMVILEEVKGAPVEVLQRTTDMRSSGVAEVTKVHSARTHARTRICMLSNPRRPIALEAYSFGVEALVELMGSLEDVRRFDVVCFVSNTEVDLGVVRAPEVQELLDRDLCRRLILWAWTLPVDYVRITSEARAELDSCVTELKSAFDEAVPLVDSGTINVKVLRLACAVAVRTFCRDDHGRLSVLASHVRVATDLLSRNYGTDAAGYARLSAAVRRAKTLHDEPGLVSFLSNIKHVRHLVDVVLTSDDFQLSDVMDACDMDRESALTVISRLVRHRGIVRHGRFGYRKLPQLIRMLNRVDWSGVRQEQGDDEEM